MKPYVFAHIPRTVFPSRRISVYSPAWQLHEILFQGAIPRTWACKLVYKSWRFEYSSETRNNCEASKSRRETGEYKLRSAEFNELLTAWIAFRVGFTRNKLCQSNQKYRYLWEMTSLFALSCRALKYSAWADSSLSSNDDSDIPASPSNLLPWKWAKNRSSHTFLWETCWFSCFNNLTRKGVQLAMQV